MMPPVPCPKCGKTETKPHPRGSWWRDARCAQCNAIVTKCFGEWIADSELLPVIIADKSLLWGHPAGRHHEFWYQIYFRENAEHEGFRVIEPVRPIGPDFIVDKDGQRRYLEIETSWRVFIEHKHDLDNRFDDCILAVMCPHEPISQMRKLLPDDIHYMDQDRFHEWYQTYHKIFETEVKSLFTRKPPWMMIRPTGRRGPDYGQSFRR
jgi:hypothetical protein